MNVVPIALLFLLLAPRVAQAYPAKECVRAAETAQELRGKKKLRAAREALHRCALAECPALVRGDCIGWLDEVQKTMPSVVFFADDETGQDRTDVRISLGSFAFFALYGKSQIADLERCSPHCESTDVGAARRSYFAADISLGVSAVALGIAAYLLAVGRPPVVSDAP
jgi:hypothetical protein